MGSGKKSCGAAVVLIGLLLFSLLIVYATLSPFLLALRQLAWTQTQCEIEAAAFTKNDGVGSITVAYRYTHRNQAIRSTTFSVPSNVVISDRTLKEYADKLQPQTTAPCWVSGDEIPVAVLHREQLSVGIALLFPLILIPLSIFGFVSMGYVALPTKGVGDALQTSRSTGRAFDGKAANDTNIEKRAPSKLASTIGLFLFFGAFILVGIGLTYLFFGQGYLAYRKMQAWTPTKCTMQSSSVETHWSGKNDDKPSYSIKVAYHYLVGGKKFVGDTYNPAVSTFSNRSNASEIVGGLAPDSTVDCFINPSDPLETSIARDFPARGWLGLIPLVFSFAGFFGLTVALSQQRARKVEKGRTPGTRLRRSSSRFKGFWGLVAVTIVWNSIVGAVSYGLLMDTAGIWKAFLPLLIITPFALIGLLLLASIPYAFLQIFNPTLDLELPDRPPSPGETFSVGYKLDGNPRRIRRLQIVLELWARPPAPSTKGGGGSRSAKHGNVFKPLTTITLLDTDREQAFAKGTASTRLPESSALPRESMGVHCEWKLRWNLSIPFYPDSSETIPVKTEVVEDSDDEA